MVWVRVFVTILCCEKGTASVAVHSFCGIDMGFEELKNGVSLFEFEHGTDVVILAVPVQIHIVIVNSVYPERILSDIDYQPCVLVNGFNGQSISFQPCTLFLDVLLYSQGEVVKEKRHYSLHLS